MKIFEGIKHPNLVRYFGVELHRVGGLEHSVRTASGAGRPSRCSRLPSNQESSRATISAFSLALEESFRSVSCSVAHPTVARLSAIPLLPLLLRGCGTRPR